METLQTDFGDLQVHPKFNSSTMPHDPVNHPSHYTSHPSGVECITVTRHMNFNLGNVMKYIWRADHKEAPLQDLEKALFYLKDEITKRKTEHETKS